MGGYQIPADLSSQYKTVRQEYNKEYPDIEKQNPVRKHQLTLSEILGEVLADPCIKALIPHKKKSLVEAGVGCLIMADIGREYGNPIPLFSAGYVYNWGSKLFTIFYRKMKIDADTNPLRFQKRIVYLEHLYNLVIANPKAKDRLTDILKEYDLKLEDLDEMMLNAFDFTMTYLKDDVEQKEQAPPTTKAFEKQVLHLHSDYVEGKSKQSRVRRFFTDPTREMFAQLAEVLCIVVSKENFEEPKQQNKHEFERKRKIENGLLFFVSQINSNGVLTKRVMEILNRGSIDDIDNQIKSDGLAALKHYLIDTHVIAKIAATAQDRFGDKNLLTHLDGKINKIHIELDRIICELESKINNNLPIANAFAKIGYILGKIPGYGFGWGVGLYCSKVPFAYFVQGSLGQVINVFSKIMGLSKNYLGDWAAGIFIESTTTRAGGKAFEKLGGALGALTFGSLGLFADGTKAAVRSICRSYLHIHDHQYNPIATNEDDAEFMRSLLRLPDKVYDHDRKAKIHNLYEDDFYIDHEMSNNNSPRLGQMS